MAQELRALGLRTGPDGIFLTHFDNWGFHLYYNLPALVLKASVSPDGFPWSHPLNKDSVYDYDKGALPRTDSLFERSIIQAIPANLVDQDIDDIVACYREAAAKVLR